jgi:hypothetical protein
VECLKNVEGFRHRRRVVGLWWDVYDFYINPGVHFESPAISGPDFTAIVSSIADGPAPGLHLFGQCLLVRNLEREGLRELERLPVSHREVDPLAMMESSKLRSLA